MNDRTSFQKYYKNVFADIHAVKLVYPFIDIYSPPTANPQEVEVVVIAADKELVSRTGAEKEDFLGLFSRELKVIVPFDYQVEGCQVYGGRWIDRRIVTHEYQHFNGKNSEGDYLFCVGVPDSFIHMENVILENIRTADKMLTAYELFQTGRTKTLELIQYSHGGKGIKEYEKRKDAYKTK